MKQKTHHLFYLFRKTHKARSADLFYPRGWITIVFLLFSTIVMAQEQTPPKEFVLDAYISYDALFNEPVYDSFIDCGFNTMTQRATNESKPLLEDFNLHAINMQDSLQLIYWYSSAYYSKWEAEEDQPYWNKVGVKHSAGQVAYWNNGNDSVLCWSTKGVTGAVDTLVYGPTYHQEKWYRRWLYQDNLYNLQYTPRFRMALEVNGDVSPDEDVCRIYVILKYRWIVDNVPEPYDDDLIYTLKEPVTLKVSDFPSNGAFGYIYFSNNPDERSYEYPSWTRDPVAYKSIMPDIEGTYYQDRWGGQGVQFCIDWLRTDTLCTLYIDNIEVYDNNGWNRFLENPVQRAIDIKTYAQNYSDWTNIKHWMGGHEPSSIDSYTPIRIVDSLIQSVGAPPLMNTVWAHWELKVNEESQLERYYNMVQPNKLLVEFHPIQAEYVVPPPFAFEVVRRIMQESYTVTQEKKFYYHVQSYGHYKEDHWELLRRPSFPEYKTTVMLALSHGADGLVQAIYNSEPWDSNSVYLGIMGLIGLAPEYEPSDLWYGLKDNLIPRLKGKLGKTLMKLNYTGNYIPLSCNGCPNHDRPTLSYLTIDCEASTYNWHVGFFEHKDYPDNKHFFLTNLITTNDVTAKLTVTNNTGNENVSFTDIEGGSGRVDTTLGISAQIEYFENMPAGEGRLYRVAPVVKYGGRLLYSEATQPGMILEDDMTVENGAVLTINGVYSSKGNIIVKSGTIINGSNGKIQFVEGKKLIIKGNGTILSTTGNKLELIFTERRDDNITGIMIQPGGSLSISNCKVADATIGIESLLNANYLNAQNVDFINCETHSINILGRTQGINLTPPPADI